MASGSQDYWMTKSRFVADVLENIFAGIETGGDLVNALDALDGTMDGVLTLSELNTSSVKTNLDTLITKLTDNIAQLVLAVTQLTGVHSDTTDWLDYGVQDGSGLVRTPWSLISSVNSKRNVLEVTHVSLNNMEYSRDGSTKAGDFPYLGDVVVHDSPGFWLRSTQAAGSNYSFHEESAI